ncbi:hypothetical protein EDB87DRAFT_1634828 [Lactarius vividus]|nr:hypothetical protein EDB87DRAFT_1634828 [Lactarius vividus]
MAGPHRIKPRTNGQENGISPQFSTLPSLIGQSSHYFEDLKTMDQHRHSPQPTVRYSWDPVHVSDSGFSTQLRSLLVPDASIFHDNWESSPLLSTAEQHGTGYFPPIFSQVDAMANIYTPVVMGSSNHQPSPTFSRSDEIYQTSVDDNALSSLPDVFPRHQTRVEVPNARLAVQVDFVADGFQRNQRFDTHTLPIYDQILNESQVITDVVANSSEDERYATKETQISMTPFGAKSFPDGSCPLAYLKNSTSGSTRLRTRSQEAIQVSPIYNKGEYLSS